MPHWLTASAPSDQGVPRCSVKIGSGSGSERVAQRLGSQGLCALAMRPRGKVSASKQAGFEARG